ncbi:YggS family pyridoxal phosphate enzyme [Mageeibacillus indolicus]|uniref:YggS family pyridoxal phosphate enzyme n=1 Tax=Mageeibacillus indolicus TaxID=884684 RepID=UPI0005541D38
MNEMMKNEEVNIGTVNNETISNEAASSKSVCSGPAYTDLLRERLDVVQQKIVAACAAAKRDPREVQLIAVTKTKSLEEIKPLLELGIYDWGENRCQEMLSKQAELTEFDLAAGPRKRAEIELSEAASEISGRPGHTQANVVADNPINWHLIGSLQKNKVKYAVGKTCLIHSVDSLELLLAINARAAKLAQAGADAFCQPVLLEVNYSGETSKHGFAPTAIAEILSSLKPGDVSNIRIDGLMTVAPKDAAPAALLEIFNGVRNLRDHLNKSHPWSDTPELNKAVNLRELSMGMSHDYPLAIEAGATMIRLGTVLLGPRVIHPAE